MISIVSTRLQSLWASYFGIQSSLCSSQCQPFLSSI
uniref:Uncharacterized protein n=1 Tax=Klebsiella phage Hope TaxID=3350564 RepID=A0AB74UIM5_9CAUD